MSTTRGLRILVVDDHQSSALAIRDLLLKRGHTTEVVHDGQSALEAGLRFVPHLALVDVRLPGIDGHEVTRRLRGQPGGRSMAIVIVSGLAHPTAVDDARAAGADHFLLKPVDFDTLWQIVDDTVQGVFGP